MMQRLLVAVAFIAGLTSSNLAAEDGSGCDCYALTAWTAKEGLPVGNVLAITQDASGFLWLGMNGAGLVRFDGFQFQTFTPKDGPDLLGGFIPAMVAARDGSVWVGFGDSSGVSRVQSGHVTNYSTRDGLDVRAVAAMLEDRNGTLWAGGIGGLWAFNRQRWQWSGQSEGLPPLDVFSLYEDSKGGLWVGTSAGIFRRAPHETRFVQQDSHSLSIQSFAEDRAGTMWVSDSRVMLRTLDPLKREGVVTPTPLEGSGARLLHDSRDNLWIAALGEGLFRAHRAPGVNQLAVERLSYENRFPGAARSVFEDRDHNIWVGLRSGGLLRLSAGPIKADIRLAGLTNDGVRALTQTSDGSVWVATSHDLNQFSPDGHELSHVFDQTLALYGDKAGHLWVATARAVGTFADGQLMPLNIPSSVRLERTLALSKSRDGLWLCNYDQGLFRWQGTTLSSFDEVADVSHRPCDFVYTDSHDRVWIGFVTGGVAVYDHGTFRSYGESEGITNGGIQAIYEDSAGAIWITSKNGVTRVRNDRLTTADTHNGLPGNLVPSLVQSADGDLWIGVNAGAAIVRFHPAEMDKVAGDHSYQIVYALYDESDGLRGPLLRLSRPTALKSASGTLWFVSGDSVALLDPAAALTPRSDAVPRIDRVIVDGKDLPSSGRAVLPRRAQNLEIDYAALNLSSASKLRFRYMLQGFDKTWVEAGARRLASYTNLDPGSYRFRVMAGGSGGWTAPEAAWEFAIPPPFYRAYWFYTICAAGLTLMVGLLWWIRLRAVRNEYALVLAERARVSRDIHDGLLQSLGAFSLQLEIIARQLDPTQTVARNTLRHVRTQIGECLAEARRAIWELRSPRIEAQDLADAFRAMTNDPSYADSAHIHVVVQGRPRRCAPRIEEQLLKIGKEAITNAVRHGQADEITLTLEYSRRSVSLRVADNGTGFVPASRTQHERDSHWGLHNMRERADSVKGSFVIFSNRDHGTVVTATVPFK
jgi:ligand-binding sensor domain-containing protein